jgi:hypothetical protein
MFFSSCFHISLSFYQIHTAPATGKRKIRRYMSEIFDTKRRIWFSYWKQEVTRAMKNRERFSFWQAGQVWPHFCFLLSGKQCKCHDTLKKVHSLASCRLQKLVEAPPQAPIRISDFI